MSDETRQAGDGSQAAGGPETTSAASAASAAEPPPATGAGPTAGADPAAPAPRGPRRRTLLAIGLVAVIVVTAVGFGVTRVITPDRSCAAPAEHPEWSVARRWDEALLDAIRRALPNPPVHARNLFHTSVAMWDAWAAYDPTANGYVYTTKEQAGDVAAARDEAISYAAYRVLSARFIKAVGGARVAGRVRGRHGHPVLPADGQHDRGRLARRGRQPHRGRRPRLWPGRRLEPGERLRGAGLHAGQRPARRQQARHDDEGPQPLAAAPARADDLAERDPGGERRPAGRRPALGPRARLRHPRRRRRRRADGSRAAAAARRDAASRTRRTRTRRSRSSAESSMLDAAVERDDRHLARRPSAATRWGPTTAPATR